MEITKHEAIFSPNQLIAVALSEKCEMDRLEKLLELREKYEKEQSRKAYLSSLSKFQSVCPEIKKTSSVSYQLKDNKGSTSYKFASLGTITKTISKPLGECGLSYRWEIGEEGTKITVTCFVHHSDGHFEQTSMYASADNSGYKNEIQAKASTITYLRRYTLVGLLGIGTGDAETDGGVSPEMKGRPQQKQQTEATKEEINTHLKIIGDCTTYSALNNLWKNTPKKLKDILDINEKFKTMSAGLKRAEAAQTTAQQGKINLP